MWLAMTVLDLMGSPLALQRTPADSSALLARGKRVYAEQRCRLCHSIAGVGNTRSPLDGVGSRLSAAQIRAWIVSPREMDPNVRKRAYRDIPPADLEALVAYLQAVPPDSTKRPETGGPRPATVRR